METSPVPKSQIPIEEFKQLSQSWFFGWGTMNTRNIYIRLLNSWLIFLPLIILINSGSYTLRGYPLRIVEISSITALTLPILITIRLIIGWRYIFKRLMSEKIEYEESGWYDGQVWEKPLEWREKDILVAEYEVKPIVNQLNKIFINMIIAITIAIITYRLN
tara:strand:+ start:290 stop:775 length:486 start_codon:yes stop_codon:yes gene_type:complete